MSDYTQITDFSAKDALVSGNPSKLIVGAEHDAEFDAIATAIATKYDVADLASQAQAEAGTDNTVLMTPLRTDQAIAGGTGGGVENKVKTVDETVNNSTALQDDDALAGFTMVASKTYHIRGCLRVAIKGASDLKVAFTSDNAPTTLSVRFGMGGSGTTSDFIEGDGDTASLLSGSDQTVVVIFEGLYLTNASGATLDLQWAQDVAVAEDLDVLLGSWMSAVLLD